MLYALQNIIEQNKCAYTKIVTPCLIENHKNAGDESCISRPACVCNA